MSDIPAIGSKQVLLFTMDEPRYALNLSAVERVVQAVEITPLPKAPALIVGVINVQGQVILAVDIRPCFGLPPRDVRVSDQFILARTARRRVALVADAVNGIRTLADRDMVSANQVVPGAEYICGVAKLDDILVLICDLDQILPYDAEQKLEAILTDSPAVNLA